MEITNVLKNLFVPYNIAKLVNEKQFNEYCIAYYTVDGELSDLYNPLRNSEMLAGFTAPMYEQVIGWILEYGISVEINTDYATNCWKIQVIKIGSMNPEFKELMYNDRGNALNTAIEEALKLLK